MLAKVTIQKIKIYKMKNQKQCIYTSGSYLNDITAPIENDVRVLNAFTKELKALPTPVPVVMETLTQAVNSPESFVRNYYINLLPKKEKQKEVIPGLTLREVDPLAGMILPSLEKLIQASQVGRRHSANFDYLEMNDYVVSISESGREMLIERASHYISSDEEIEDWTHSKALAEAINNYASWYKAKYKMKYFDSSILTELFGNDQGNSTDNIVPRIGAFEYRTQNSLKNDLMLRVAMPDVDRSDERVIATRIDQTSEREIKQNRVVAVPIDRRNQTPTPTPSLTASELQAEAIAKQAREFNVSPEAIIQQMDKK